MALCDFGRCLRCLLDKCYSSVNRATASPALNRHRRQCGRSQRSLFLTSRSKSCYHAAVEVQRRLLVTYPLTTLSPLDGRYRAEVAALEAYFSEAALFRYRARVEIEYLIFLTKSRDITCVPKLTVQATAELRGLYRYFSLEDAEA